MAHRNRLEALHTRRRAEEAVAHSHHRAEACNHPWVAWAVQAEAEGHIHHSSEGEAVAGHNPRLQVGYSRLWVEWAGHPWGAFRFRPWAAFRRLSVRCRHRIADHKT